MNRSLTGIKKLTWRYEPTDQGNTLVKDRILISFILDQSIKRKAQFGPDTDPFGINS